LIKYVAAFLRMYDLTHVCWMRGLGSIICRSGQTQAYMYRLSQHHVYIFVYGGNTAFFCREFIEYTVIYGVYNIYGIYMVLANPMCMSSEDHRLNLSRVHIVRLWHKPIDTKDVFPRRFRGSTQSNPCSYNTTYATDAPYAASTVDTSNERASQFCI